MRILWLDAREYDFLMEMLDRPLRTSEEMPKLQKLMAMESPFASLEEKCTE